MSPAMTEVTGELQSHYNGDAGWYHGDWSVKLADGSHLDLIDLFWALKGKTIRITVEEVSP